MTSIQSIDMAACSLIHLVQAALSNDPALASGLRASIAGCSGAHLNTCPVTRDSSASRAVSHLTMLGTIYTAEPDRSVSPFKSKDKGVAMADFDGIPIFGRSRGRREHQNNRCGEKAFHPGSFF
jgi:hypothetical protein